MFPAASAACALREPTRLRAQHQRNPIATLQRAGNVTNHMAARGRAEPEPSAKAASQLVLTGSWSAARAAPVRACSIRYVRRWARSRANPAPLRPLEAADRVDSTTGVQMAYLKSWAKRSENPLELRLPELVEGEGVALR